MKAFVRKNAILVWLVSLIFFMTGCEKRQQVPAEMFVRSETNSNLNVDYEWIKMTRYEGDGLYVSFYSVGIWTGDAIANSSKSTNSNDDFFYRFSNNKRGAVNEGCLVSYEIVPKLDKNSTAGCNVSHYPTHLLLDSSIEKMTLTEESGGFKLNWSPMNGTSYYYVLRRADVDNGNGTGVTSFALLLDRVSGNTYLDKNVVTGKYYEYYVLAYKQSTGLDVKSVATGSSYFDGTNSGGGGGSSSSSSAPSGLYISMYNSGTTTTVYLQWFGVSDAINYKVYRATDPNGIWAYYASSKTEDYEDTKVSNGVTYYYRVSAITSSGEGPKSSYVSCTISNSGSGGGGGGSSTTTKPSTPTGLTATANQSYISLSWNSVSGASKYNVYRSTSAYGTFSFVKSTTSTNYSDSSVSSGTTYYYKVSAENGNGESSLSSYVSAKLGTSGGGGGGGGSTTTNYAPCPPTITCTGSSSITVRWSAASGYGCGNPTYYTVKRNNPMTGGWETLQEKTTSYSYTDSKPFPLRTTYAVTATNSYGSESNFAVASEASIATPSITKVNASKKTLEVTIKDLDVPDSWKQYYYLQLHTSSGSTYYIDKSWKYSDATRNSSAKTLTFRYDYPVDMSGKSFNIKVKWFFDAGSKGNNFSSFSTAQSVRF